MDGRVEDEPMMEWNNLTSGCGDDDDGDADDDDDDDDDDDS